ncbi:MAG: hypothetical protein IT462_11250 [Planctomycetes bacterium]|nr:hypothetical protein [Planctomycetota bacterium]
MSDLLNTTQQDDPHGLTAVQELLEHQDSRDFGQRIVERAPELRRVEALLKRVQRFAPAIAFSEEVMGMLQVLDRHERESARMLAVAGAA